MTRTCRVGRKEFDALPIEEQTALVLQMLWVKRWNRYITEHPQKSRPTKARAAGVPSYKLERERGYVT